MNDYIPLSPEQKTNIVDGLMTPHLLKTQRMEQPTIVLVVAQPGAGKSKAASLAKNELRNELRQEGGLYLCKCRYYADDDSCS